MIGVVLLVLLLIIYFIYRSYKTSLRVKRLKSFSLNDNNSNTIYQSFNISFWNFIDKISNGLNDYKIVRLLSKKYDKYILKIERKYKNSVNYFAIKLLLIIILLVSYIIMICLSIVKGSFITLLIIMIVGYIIPDIFWHYNYTMKLNVIKKHLYFAIKNIYSQLKKGNTLVFAIKYSMDNCPLELKDEFDKVIEDIDNGIHYVDAFRRLYKRIRLGDSYLLYQNLYIGYQNNVNLDIVFLNTVNDMKLRNDRVDEQIKVINNSNIIVIYTIFIPVIILLGLLNINVNYYIKLFSGKGIFILIIILLIYSIYMLIINIITEVKDE